jgi:hypothetical protein
LGQDGRTLRDFLQVLHGCRQLVSWGGWLIAMKERNPQNQLLPPKL